MENVRDVCEVIISIGNLRIIEYRFVDGQRDGWNKVIENRESNQKIWGEKEV